MTTTPTDGDATTTPTSYAAGLGAVAAYSGDVIAPGAPEGSTSKYTAGNQVQSA